MYHIDLSLVFGVTTLTVAVSFYYLILRNTVTLECMIGYRKSKKEQNLSDLSTGHSSILAINVWPTNTNVCILIIRLLHYQNLVICLMLYLLVSPDQFRALQLFSLSVSVLVQTLAWCPKAVYSLPFPPSLALSHSALPPVFRVYTILIIRHLSKCIICRLSQLCPLSRLDFGLD